MHDLRASKENDCPLVSSIVVYRFWEGGAQKESCSGLSGFSNDRFPGG